MAWTPTHVQVLVKRARGLIVKGKNGTNDAFVTIGLGKEKYQTSVKEKSGDDVEWCEQCELVIPQKGNTAEIQLTVLHRNFLGVDEFLELVSIPLSEFDQYDKPKTKWYTLKCKPGQNKNDYRGDLEVRTSFTVKALTSANDKALGSTSDLGKSKGDKAKGSLQSLNKAASNFGGSLLSLGTKEKKNLKKLAKSVTHKVEKVGEKAKRTLSKTNLSKDDTPHQQPFNPTYSSPAAAASALPNKFSVKDFDLDASFGTPSKTSTFRRVGSGKNRDPGVNSDDEDDVFKFDALSHRSSNSSLNVGPMGLVSKASTPVSGSFDNLSGGQAASGPANDLYRRSFGTPINARKEEAPFSTPNNSRKSDVTPAALGDTPLGTPRTSRSYLMMSDATAGANDGEPALDEWEAKLLGKKKVLPYKSPDSTLNVESSSPASVHSGQLGSSANKSAGSSQSRPAQLTAPQETPSGRKKIIPVGLDNSVSSPDDTPPSPPSPVPTFALTNRSNNSCTNNNNKSNSLTRDQSSSSLFGSDRKAKFSIHDDSVNEDDLEKKRRSIGLKLKTSYRSLVETGRTGSLFNLSQLNRGFTRDKDDKRQTSSRDLRISSESITGQSRNSSDDSHNPPSGPRVVLGRETTPTPLANGNKSPRIPKEVLDRFDGKSREDLIEMIVCLQDRVEKQAKKQSDTEDYLDALLIKVIQKAPELLQKNALMDQKYGLIAK